MVNDRDFITIKYKKIGGMPEWAYKIQVIDTCDRCEWRFVWKRERKYCSDKCRWNRDD